MMEEDREQSEQPLDCFCILYECDCRYSDCDHCFIFFQENKSHSVEPLHWSSVYTLLIHVMNNNVLWSQCPLDTTIQIFVAKCPLNVLIQFLETKMYPGEFGEFCPDLTLNMSVTTNRTPPTHGLVGCLALPYLNLNTVSHNQRNSTNPWIGWACSLT